jgi:glycerol-3-phosphate cytidylyltransferase
MKAKKIADQVVVSVNTDEFVLRYKGKAPVYTLEERMELVRACKYVDQVVINEGDEDSTVAILKTRPNFILHSAEWSGEALMEQMGISQKFLDDYNILMVYVDRTPDISSTDLRARIIKA